MKIKMTNMAHQVLILDVLKFYVGRMDDWVDSITIHCCDTHVSDRIDQVHQVYLMAEMKNGEKVKFHEAQPDKKIAIHRIIERLNRFLMRQKLAHVSKADFSSRVNNNV